MVIELPPDNQKYTVMGYELRGILEQAEKQGGDKSCALRINKIIEDVITRRSEMWLK